MIAQPLTTLTRKGLPWRWTDVEQKAFNGLKHALTTAPVLKLPDVTKPFVIVSDASGFAVGAILMQDGQPVAYHSRAMNDVEKRYPTHDRELLGIYEPLKQWRCYIEGVETICQTDHNPLQHIRAQPNLSMRQARWLEFMEGLSPTVKYIPGEKNPADALSRVEVPGLAHEVSARSGLSGLHGAALRAKLSVVRLVVSPFKG